ncbi:MAG: tyrosine-type recombinase/integrase [Chitinophagaceae bacterium]
MLHRNTMQILIKYAHSVDLNNAIRQLKGIKWSQSHKAWYLPLSQVNYEMICICVKPLATTDVQKLKQYLETRNTITNCQAVPQATKPIKPLQDSSATIQPLSGINNLLPKKVLPQTLPVENMSTANRLELEKAIQHLQLKAYSSSTIKTYKNEIQLFFKLLGQHQAEKLNTADVKRYLLKCITEGISENTMHSRINALKFYYEQVLGREKFFVEIPRPKKELQLPKFFNQAEIAGLIKQTGNLKHRTMLMLCYSAGLRVSETVAIKVYHIDSKRMQITIRQAKGKKDRMAPLSPVLLVMLREYFRAYKPDPRGFLFEGEIPGSAYSARSLQQIMQAAKIRAGILKPGGVHALRHSFATHLLDKGTDITMIMKLLGHNDLKTTLRYLHVTNRDILKLISPLDDLDL